MAFEFHLPDIGEGVVEGEVVKWKVNVGDVVALDQPIVEIMTDKATVEIPSPRAGTIAKINYREGEICPVGEVLLVISDTQPTETPVSRVTASDAVPRQGLPRVGGVRVAPTPPAPPVMADGSSHNRTLATPATRRLARQLGIEIARVPATGNHGRITTDDVRRFRTQPNGTATAVPGAGPAPVVSDEELRIPLRGVRKKIAEAMARSVHTAAHFTYVEEIDMTELVTVREHAKPRAAERGIKLTYLPFMVKAVVASLKKWPMLNASLDEATQEIVQKRYYHIGIAAQGPAGLVVSVIRDADRRSIFDLAQEIERLAAAVKAGTATRDELTGSTFTISSLGKLGGVLATPIINFPEVAIMGVHKIEEKPAVRAGAIAIRHLMNLSISVDHRLADGWDGAMFLQDVKALLEDPTTMFMEMV